MKDTQGLYQRGGIWWLRFTPAPGVAQLRVSLETTDLIEAIRAARVVRDEKGAEARKKIGSCETEVADFLAHCRHQGRAKSTLLNWTATLHRFIAAAQCRSPKMISAAFIQKWFDGLLREHEQGTAISYITAVRAWFRWLKDTHKIQTNPAAKVVVPKLAMQGRMVFLSQTDAERLLAAAKDPDLKFALYCALHAGMRKNEIIQARAEWFDLRAGLIHVQKTPTFMPKARKNRTIPMSTEFKQWLTEEFGLRQPFMFRPESEEKKSLYRNNFARSYNTLVKACGMDVTFHDLRRTFGSLHVSSGTSIYKVAKWLGDTLAVVESTYGHLIAQDDDINKAWEKRETKTSTAPAAADAASSRSNSAEPDAAG